MHGPSSLPSRCYRLLPVMLAGLLSACAGVAKLEPAPLPPLASESLARARQAWARGVAADDPELLTALAEARAIDPGWVAPRRMEDDLLLAEHREVEALARRRAELAEAPGDAGLCYLVSRLEGADDGQLFLRATQLDPALAWGWHGVAWTRTNERDYPAAMENEERAIALARDPWERAFFTMALARQLRAAQRAPEGLERLRAFLDEPGLDATDWAAFACDVALMELDLLGGNASKMGYLRGLELIRGDRLTPRDLTRLVLRMQTSLTIADPTGLELELALAVHPGPLRERLRRQRWLQRKMTPMGRLLLEREVERGELESVGEALTFRGTFSAGWYTEAIRDWLVNLPAQVLADDGLPRDPRLRRVVETAYQVGSGLATAETLNHFGLALLRAGWFHEALGVADTLAEHDLDRALELRERAAAGRVLFAALSSTLIDVEKGREDIFAAVSSRGSSPPERIPPAEDDPEEPESSDLDGIDEVLRRWAPLFATAGKWLGGPTDLQQVTDYLLASPRIEYGFLAAVVHPGQHFSAEEQEAGLGREGQPVPGLAPLMARYGRFAILGEVLGAGGPDGTVLRLLHLEEASGEHLGVPWKGTIAWCDGTDLDSRAARHGARIAGAALHEGYWVDLASARYDRDRWNALAAQFSGEDGDRRLTRALSTRGLRLRTTFADPDRRLRERTATSPTLGQANRVRLAVMMSRREAGEVLGGISLTELAELIAVHEQGHLCDRTRFLPLGSNLGRAFVFLAKCGFSPSAIQARLEYRAQLTALCEVADPRLPLVEMLDTVDAQDLGGLPHADAYRNLLGDLLRVLDQEVERDPEKWGRIDLERTLLHQLHWLSGEEVRGLARKVARREGLF